MDDFFTLTAFGSKTMAAGRPFGIADLGSRGMVVTTMVNPAARWSSAVEQVRVDAQMDVVFSPIDKNPRYESAAVDANGNKERKCDCFLHSESKDVIVFVELKQDPDLKYPRTDLLTAEQLVESDSASDFLQVASREDANWQEYAIWQLKTTIDRFKSLNPEVNAISPSIHRAYIANKACDYDAEYMTIAQDAWFRQETGYFLSVRNHIEIENPPPKLTLKLDVDDYRGEMIT